MKIAVLIPCYNEELTVQKVVQDFRKELPEAQIFVYDKQFHRSDGGAGPKGRGVRAPGASSG